MRPLVSSLGLASIAIAAIACQNYNLEEVEPQTIVAVETFRKFERVAPPTLLVLQDRSASMDACFDPQSGLGPTTGCKELPGLQTTDRTRRSRMEVARQVMIRAAYSSREDVQFGLVAFGGDEANPTCGAPKAFAEPADGSYLDVIDAFESDPFLVKPAGGTPTTAALRRAYELLVDPTTNEPLLPDRHNFVVLVTDGLMNCNADHGFPCACASEGGCTRAGGGTLAFGEVGTPATAIQCLDDDPAVDAVRRLADAGVRTFVVGLGEIFGGGGDDLASSVLDRLAEAGGAPRQDGPQKFYSASDPKELQDSIEKIARQISAPCAYQLDGPVCDGRLLQVALRIDGQRIETSCSEEEGPQTWFFGRNALGELDGSTITFSKDVCDRLDDAESVEVSLRGIEFGCPDPSVQPSCSLRED